MQNIILAGFGFMGTMHAQVYRQLETARIAAVVDTNRSAVRRCMRKLEVNAPLFGTLAEALDGEADAVDICLPTDLHRSFALEALSAGKHLFCEKPIALTTSDAQTITRAAEKAGVAAQIGQCIRFWPEYQAFRDVVRSGKAGALLSLSLQRRAALPRHSVGGWLLDPARSGGAAVDLHVHDTDFVLDLLGLPDAVRAAATFDAHGPSHIFTNYFYKDVAVSAEGGWNYPLKWGFQMAFQAVFENGTVEYDSGASPTLAATFGKSRRKPLPFRNPSIGPSRTGAGNISALGGYFNELRYFLHSLESGLRPEIATPAQAAQSLRVVLAEIESGRSGRKVRIR